MFRAHHQGEKGQRVCCPGELGERSILARGQWHEASGTRPSWTAARCWREAGSANNTTLADPAVLLLAPLVLPLPLALADTAVPRVPHRHGGAGRGLEDLEHAFVQQRRRLVEGFRADALGDDAALELA